LLTANLHSFQGYFALPLFVNQSAFMLCPGVGVGATLA